MTLPYIIPKTKILARMLADWKASSGDAFRFTASVFLTSRVLLVLASLAGVLLIPADAKQGATLAASWHLWQQWDANHYLAIATNGYLPGDAVGRGLTSPAFFPLYPFLCKLVSFLTFGDIYVAALLVSNIALFMAGYQFYRLVQRDFSLSVARGAVLALVAFPTALFFFVPYAESLFLALAISAMRAIRLHHWFAAGLWGLFAALTRQAGILLMLPFAWECLAALGEMMEKPTGQEAAQGRFAHWWATLRTIPRSTIIMAARSLSLVLLIPIGTALYGLWLWHAVGDPLAFIHAQAAWGRHWNFPLLSVWDGLRYALMPTGYYFLFRAWFDLVAVLCMAALLLWGRKLLPATYLWYALPLYLIFLSQPEYGWALISQARFMLELFPLFIVLGALLVRRRILLWTYLIAIGTFQLGLMAMFARGGWIT